MELGNGSIYISKGTRTTTNPPTDTSYMTAGIDTQPAAVIRMFSPQPKPPSLDVPFDLTPEQQKEYKRPLPWWLKVDKRTKIPPVLKRVFGWLKITKWQRDICDDIITNIANSDKKPNPRKVRREFRSRVTAVKRAERKKRLAEMMPFYDDDDVGFQQGGLNMGQNQMIIRTPAGLEGKIEIDP